LALSCSRAQRILRVLLTAAAMLAVLPASLLSSPVLSSPYLRDPLLIDPLHPRRSLLLDGLSLGAGWEEEGRSGLELGWPSSSLSSFNPLRLSLRSSPSHDAWIVSASTPGLPASAIKLELVGLDTLTMTVDERLEADECDDGSSSPQSRSYLQQSIRLPSPVDPSGVRTSYRDGLLTVHAPAVNEVSTGVEEEPAVAALQAQAQQARLAYLALLDQLRIAKQRADDAELQARAALKAAAAARSRRRVKLPIGGEQEQSQTAPSRVADDKPACPCPDQPQAPPTDPATEATTVRNPGEEAGSTTVR